MTRASKDFIDFGEFVVRVHRNENNNRILSLRLFTRHSDGSYTSTYLGTEEAYQLKMWVKEL